MSRETLTQVSVRTSLASENTLSVFVEEMFQSPTVSWSDEESGAVTVSVYLDCKRWPVRAAKFELEQSLGRIGKDLPPLEVGKLRVRSIRKENWSESWKRHFPPMEFGRALLVRPSWSRKKARPGQSVVEIDPGLSFGTGRHPTTAFCLRQLVKFRSRDQQRSFLDMGTGSGLLAIAASKLGFAPVEAFDFDPTAVRIARANARRNRVAGRVRIARRNLAQLPPRSSQSFDLVCANLTPELLEKHRRRITARLKPNGLLVLAGILQHQFAEVAQAYESIGLSLVTATADGEWKSGTFARQKVPRRF